MQHPLPSDLRNFQGLRGADSGRGRGLLCNKSVASRGPPSRDGVLRVLLFTQERGEEVDDPWGHGVAILTIQLQRRGAGTSVVIYVIYVWRKRRRNKKKKEGGERTWFQGWTPLSGFSSRVPRRGDPPRNWDRRKWIDGGTACFEIGTIIP